MKRAVSVLVGLILILSLGVIPGVAVVADEKEAPYHATVVMTGEQQEDQERIVDAINEILIRDLNIEIELIVLPWGNALEQKRLMLTSGEPLDLMMTSLDEALSFVANGQLNDLSELIDKYGTNIKEVFGEEGAKASAIGSFVYGVYNNNEIGATPAIGMRKDLVEKYDIDTESIHSLEDLEPVLALIKEKEPSITPLHVASDQPPVDRVVVIDKLSDGLAVLPNRGLESTTIVPVTECEEWIDELRLVHSWFEKGYINQDAATTTVAFEAAFRAGDNFAAMMYWMPNSPKAFGGQEMVYAPLDEHVAFSGATGGVNWAIPINSEDPEKAMQLLDYLYGSSEIMQLLNWGEEGIDWDYVDKENNVINYPEGVTEETATYHYATSWAIPNQFICSVWEGVADPDVAEQMAEFNASGLRSKAFGFAFDPTGYENLMTALNNVKDKYYTSLATGAVDPDEYIPLFAEELEKNGIRELCEAKQAQFDAWLAENGAKE